MRLFLETKSRKVISTILGRISELIEMRQYTLTCFSLFFVHTRCLWVSYQWFELKNKFIFIFSTAILTGDVFKNNCIAFAVHSYDTNITVKLIMVDLKNKINIKQ